MPDQVYSVQWNGSEKLGFAYDNLGRLAQKNFGGGNSFGIKYAYENYEIAKADGTAEKRTTALVKSVETPAGTYSYEYDKLGNIISVANGKRGAVARGDKNAEALAQREMDKATPKQATTIMTTAKTVKTNLNLFKYLPPSKKYLKKIYNNYSILDKQKGRVKDAAFFL